jgi:hypothetical protein
MFCLGFVRFSLSLFLWLFVVVEISATGDNTLFSLVPDSNLDSAFLR